VYSDFAEAVARARAEAEIAAVARIRERAHDGTWQADAWFLERAFPERWGRRGAIPLPEPPPPPSPVKRYTAEVADHMTNEEEDNSGRFLGTRESELLPPVRSRQTTQMERDAVIAQTEKAPSIFAACSFRSALSQCP